MITGILIGSAGTIVVLYIVFWILVNDDLPEDDDGPS